jgi:peptidoglycan-associated lipoprotein
MKFRNFELRRLGQGTNEAESLRKTFCNLGRSNSVIQLKRVQVLFVLLLAMFAVAGCKKNAPPPAQETAPPSSAVPAPTAQITATPTVISAGDQVQLAWRPSESTTYHLVARGEGGSADASARITVNAPPVVNVPSTTLSAEQEFKAHVQDVFFDYDTYDIRTDAQAALSQDASFLVSHPEIKIVIGGYCDERGSNEYNLALGQNRANATKNALVTAGVAATRIRVVSYGKEKPFCSDSTESCWQQNRRAGFSIDQ